MDTEVNMEVYINNEEVVCDRNIKITENLAITNSTILNNVYPKTWENDRDYVSRFYMPRDYEDVLITNGEKQTDWHLNNNILIRDNRKIDTKIKLDNTSRMMYVRVIPGKHYIIKTVCYETSETLYEFDKLNINTEPINTISVSKGYELVDITPTGNYIAINYMENDEKKIEYGDFILRSNYDVVFSGYVKNSGNINLNPRYPHYATLQALDWDNLLSEGDMLNYVMPSMKTSDVLKYLIKDLPGFYVGDIKIDNDEIMAPYNCDQKTPFDVLEYIAEVSGAIWYTSVIDDKVVTISLCSPGQLESEDIIEYTGEYFETNNIQNITYSYNSQDYRNKQVISNNKAQASTTHTETFLYDGGNITTEYPISEIVSVKNGTIPYSFANVQTGETAYFTYETGSNTVYVNEIATGFTFTIEYYPIINLRQTAYNLNEIDRISNVHNGVISRYESRTDTNDANALNRIAQSYIEYKSVPEIVLKVQTYDKDIFSLGKQVLFNAPLEALKTKYLVKSKTIEMIVTGTQKKLFYTYELSSSFNDESAINYFDNQRRKQEGNLEGDEYISRYIDIPNQTNIIFYGAKLTKIEDIPVNTLDAELDMEV